MQELDFAGRITAGDFCETSDSAVASCSGGSESRVDQFVDYNTTTEFEAFRLALPVALEQEIGRVTARVGRRVPLLGPQRRVQTPAERPRNVRHGRR